MPLPTHFAERSTKCLFELWSISVVSMTVVGWTFQALPESFLVHGACLGMYPVHLVSACTPVRANEQTQLNWKVYLAQEKPEAWVSKKKELVHA